MTGAAGSFQEIVALLLRMAGTTPVRIELQMINRARTAAVLAVALTLATFAALVPRADAHKGATGIVKVRMDAMKDMKAAMKVLTAMLKGEQAFSLETAHAKASRLSGHADKIEAYYPEGSLKAPSEASPQIWADPEGFRQAIAKFQHSVDVLGRASDEDIARAAIVEIGGSCLACHDDYRVRK